MEMQPLTLEAFDASSPEYDRDVQRTDGIDAFCSASDWIIPAHHAFGSGREPWVFRGDGGWLALMRARRSDGARVLLPFEPEWGLGSPCIGGAPVRLAAQIGDLLALRSKQWDLLVLTGLVPGGAMWTALTRRLGEGHRLYRGVSSRRYRASLAGGLDGFLARRSRNMRRGLGRAERAVRARGISVEPATGAAEELYARVQAVEAKSWKGLAGGGIVVEPLRGFYARMLPRLLARGALRLVFARTEGRDVGYILGGVLGGAYRGLQFSYDQEFAPLGLGNVLQLTQLESLCAEGTVLYDLGCEVPYKARWAESILETSLLIVAR